MTGQLDEKQQRRARHRAAAASIVDAPRKAERFPLPEGGLRPSSRRRSHVPHALLSALKERIERSHHRVAQGVLVVECVVLVSLLFLPAFRAHTVTITGNRLLTRDAVLAAAQIPDRSIFTVDGDAIRNRLTAVPWISNATVVTQLPSTVRITITEKAPLLRVLRQGRDYLVTDSGATIDSSAIDQSAATKIPLLIDDRPSPANGPPLSPSLVALLQSAALRFPPVLGCSVAAYQWQSDGLFAIWAQPGWKAIIGHLDTTEQIAGIPGQLAALASLKGQVDFAHPEFGYIDLENAEAPAVGGTPGLPDEISAALAKRVPVRTPDPTAAPATAQPTPAPTAAPATPTPKPQPTPTPTPTPYILYLPTPAH